MPDERVCALLAVWFKGARDHRPRSAARLRRCDVRTL